MELELRVEAVRDRRELLGGRGREGDDVAEVADAGDVAIAEPTFVAEREVEEARRKDEKAKTAIKVPAANLSVRELRTLDAIGAGTL